MRPSSDLNRTDVPVRLSSRTQHCVSSTESTVCVCGRRVCAGGAARRYRGRFVVWLRHSACQPVPFVCIHIHPNVPCVWIAPAARSYNRLPLAIQTCMEWMEQNIRITLCHHRHCRHRHRHAATLLSSLKKQPDACGASKAFSFVSFGM